MDKIIQDIISAEEAQQILGWSLDRVYRMTREGRLPHLKRVGRVYLYSRLEIRKVARNGQ